MRVAVIFYHRHAERLYSPQWLNQCVNSIRNQTFQRFDSFELAYDGTDARYVPEAKFFSQELPGYATAANFLLDHCFYENDYDVVFNTNMDDYYSLNRFEVQLRWVLAGYDLVSSNYTIVDADDNDIVDIDYSLCTIPYELSLDVNVICNPVVAFTRKFWLGCSRYDPAWSPQEDLHLWQQECRRWKFGITPEHLVRYRKHENNVGHGTSDAR